MSNDVVARPWVEIVNNNKMLPESATFQRLGLNNSNSKVDNLNLKVSHLESRSLSPVHLKEADKDYQRYDIKDEDVHEQTTKLVEESKKINFKRHNSVKKILSPASAEVLARKDSFRSKLVSDRMSRRTLQFQSPIDMEEDVHNESSKLSIPRQELNSLKEIKETSRFSVRRRSHHKVISQSEDDPGSGRSTETVIKTNKSVVNRKFSDNSHKSDYVFKRNLVSFDNPAYISVSDNSQVQANSDRESVISPPRRSSVITPPAAAVTRASVISPPPSNKVSASNILSSELMSKLPSSLGTSWIQSYFILSNTTYHSTYIKSLICLY